MRYVEHYNTYFDRYTGLYVLGGRKREIEVGDVSFVCLGTGHSMWDLLMSPFRVYREARRRCATHFLTADLVYGWWHAVLLLLLLRAKVVAMPVCTPPEIIKNSGRTYSGHHPIIEKALITLTFLVARRIIVASNSGCTRSWLQQLWCHGKVRVVDATPEELPSVEFLDRLDDIERARAKVEPGQNRLHKLIYVGRLEPEKLVGDLIEIAVLLRQSGKKFELAILGDGSERGSMERRAMEAGIADRVRFCGFQPASRVAEELSNSDIFVSTLTGTSIKEAAFSKVALIAYAIDYIPSLFTDGENCLLADGGDIAQMAQNISILLENDERRRFLAENLYTFAKARWTPRGVKIGLEQAFGDL